jgi:hypothetical protein
LGKTDPDDLPNSMHVKIRDVLGWTNDEYLEATGFVLGEALESVEPSPGLRQVRLPILNSDHEEVLLGLRELEDHRASDLIAFRDFKEMPVLAFPDRLEFFETLPKKASILGRVIAVLKLV